MLPRLKFCTLDTITLGVKVRRIEYRIRRPPSPPDNGERPGITVSGWKNLKGGVRYAVRMFRSFMLFGQIAGFRYGAKGAT